MISNINPQYLYYLFLLTVFLIGVFLTSEATKDDGGIRYKRSIGARRSINNFVSALSDKSADEVFQKIGLKLSIRKYTAFRNATTILILAFSLTKLVNWQTDSFLKVVLFAIGFYFCTYPKDSFKGKKTPFKMCLDTIYRKKLQKKDEELSSVITQMKNIILSQQNQLVSADYILTRLLPYIVISKPVFIQTLSLVRKGRKEEAANHFAKGFGTKLGTDFSKIILKLDELDPAEFLKQLDIFQTSVQENKETNRERRGQNAKGIIYLLASVELALMVFNFMYIILMDTVELMKF